MWPPSASPTSAELMDSILEEAAKFATDILLPINASGDEEGCRLENGVVRTPKGFRRGLQEVLRGRLGRAVLGPEYGGQGLPEILGKMVEEMQCSANLSFGLYPGLTHGATLALEGHGSDELKRRYLPENDRRHLVGHHVPDRGALRHRSRHDAHQGRRRRPTAATRSTARRFSSAPASMI